MGGQSSMGGAASPTQATQGTGMQPGGFDLSKLFMGNQANTPAGGGQALPQIMAPPRQPMPVMPQRTPMPAPQAPAAAGLPNWREDFAKSRAASAIDRWKYNRDSGNRR